VTNVVVMREGNAAVADWGAGKKPCAIGRSGIGPKHREGDGVTPQGLWPVRRVLFRPDRVPRPKTALPVFAIAEDDGWCDAPEDPRYNRPVTLPYPASAERMWRDDSLYDIVVVLGFNDAPIVPGSGSAIFLHIAGPDYSATEGCVALKVEDVQALVAALTPGALIEIRS